MIEYDYAFRVLYPDTDQMGTMHHSKYAKYYEAARWELFRSIGISYRSVEEAGFLLPVVRMNFTFYKTVCYDELLTVKTTLKAIKGVRIWFEYRLYNEKQELVNKAETELAFVKSDTWSPCAPPAFVLAAIEQHVHS